MSTWNDIINQSCADINLIQVGQTLTGSLLADCQARLNQFLGSLNTEGLTVFNQVLQTFNLQYGVDSYTLGVGGTWGTTSRAQKVTAWRAAYNDIRKGGAPLSMEAFAAAAAENHAALAELYVKALLEGVIASYPPAIQSPIPSILGADTAYPLIHVRVSPPPSAVPGSVELAFWTPIAAITNFASAVALPDGWEEMIRSNFAVKLFAAYPREGGIPPELAAAAQNSKAAIVAQNTMQTPPPVQQQ